MWTLSDIQAAEASCQFYVIISEEVENNPYVRRKIEKEAGEYVASLSYKDEIIFVHSGLSLEEAYEYFSHWQ